MKWEPPGPGVWWLTRDHFPAPVSRLFAELFPPTVIGWQRGSSALWVADRVNDVRRGQRMALLHARLD